MNSQLSDLKPDIVILTETWCHDQLSNEILNIPGYNIDPNLRKDRTDTDNGRGGGIIVYTKSGLTILPNNDIKSDFIQYVSFDVHCNNHLQNFIAIYRSPNSSDTNTDKLCNIVSDHMNTNSIMIGDINLPNIDWPNNISDRKGKMFLDTTSENHVMQVVDFPTHNKGNILDLILTKSPEQIDNLTKLDFLGNSDHNMILFDVKCDFSQVKTTELIYDWSKADFDSYRYELDSINWNTFFNNCDSEEMWLKLKSKLNELQDIYVPKKLRRSSNQPAWMNRKLLQQIRKKRRVFKQWKDSNLNAKLDEYIKLSKSVQKSTKNAKKTFERKIAKPKGDGTRIFNSYVKSKTKTRTSIGSLKRISGEIVTDSTDMAEMLNDFFSSVFTREDVSNIPVADQVPHEEVLDSVHFTEKNIAEKIRKLKKGSAGGNDKISVKLLQTMERELVKPLQLIFSKSFDSGIVPSDWKEANVSPIFKKGSKSDPANYRPVSLTSICCKIMESIIKDAIVDHLDINKLINGSQHGFMKNKSCLTNLLEFFEVISCAVDQVNAVDLIYLDFAKAFDKVPKLRLLEKLKKHGISGKVWTWINSWLSKRKQRVVLNGLASCWTDVLSGVPQGSILGPILFIIFINDIDAAAKIITILRKFADDTKAGQIIAGAEDQQKLQACLNNLGEWSQTWGMQFNESKCKVIHCGKNNPCYDYEINGKKIVKSDKEKDVGIIIHKSLKPSSQCSAAARTASYVLSQVSRAFHYRDKKVFLSLYKTYVRPHLECCTPAWSPWTLEDKMVLEKVQRRAVNMISGLRSTTYEGKLKELNLLSLEERRHHSDLVQTYKILHKVNSVEESTWFTRVSNASGRVTRLSADPLNLSKETCRTELRRNFFSQRVIDKWNTLPSEVKTAPSVASFKRQLWKL